MIALCEVGSNNLNRQKRLNCFLAALKLQRNLDLKTKVQSKLSQKENQKLGALFTVPL